MIRILISLGMAVSFALNPVANEPQAKQEGPDLVEAIPEDVRQKLDEAREELSRLQLLIEKEQAARAELNRNLPKGWTAHEFNGQPVYYILCGSKNSR